MNRVVARVAVTIAALLALGGCSAWKPGWTDAAPPTAGAPGDLSAVLAKASVLAANADDRGKLAEVIALYESALARSPGDYDVLTELCQWKILDAAAYAATLREKKQGFEAGIRACERALYTNGDFRDLVDRGVPIEQAARVLTRREESAMVFWVTGVSYYFKECMRGIATLTGIPLIRKTEPMLKRMTEIDPDYGHGAVYFSRGIFYLGLPKFAGGDRVKSAELLDRAQELGPDSLLVRWGRAKYFHFEMRNREAFERDLRWVTQQDPHQASTAYAWNVYFQRDAARLLADVDRLFRPGRR